MATVNPYTTDTLQILSWQFTDKLPTHYWYYLDRLSVDLLADTQPTVKHHLANCQPTQGDANCRPIHHWYLTNTRPTLPPVHCWQTTDATSTDCWSICQLILDRQENATWPIDIDRLSINTSLGQYSINIAAKKTLHTTPMVTFNFSNIYGKRSYQNNTEILLGHE